MPDPPDPPPTVAWKKRAAAAVPRQVVPVALGVFVGDANLRKVLKDYLGGAKPCPKSLNRDLMLETAVRLNLVNPEDALVQAPQVSADMCKHWSQQIKKTQPLPEPKFTPSTYMTDSMLSEALTRHVNRTIPEKTGRATLIKHALALRIIHPEQAEMPRLAQLPLEELNTLWNNHVQKTPKKNRPAKPSGRKRLTDELFRLKLISRGHAEATAQRPDKAEDFKEGRVSVKCTRCTSVSKLFRGIPDSEKIRKDLRTLSEEASRLFYERPFLLWLHFERLIRTNRPLPDLQEDNLDKFVRWAYLIGTENSPAPPDLDLRATFKLHSSKFPTVNRPQNTNLVTHAANIYAGALRRHFAHLETVKQRIRRYISTRLLDFVIRPTKGYEDTENEEVLAVLAARRLPEVGDAPIYNILGALEDPKFNVLAMHPRQIEVLLEIRNLLGLKAGVKMDGPWLRVNIHGSIRFALHVVDAIDLRKIEVQQTQDLFERTIPDAAKRPKIHKGAARGIRFMPLNDLKRRFVTIDATSMLQIMDLEVPENSSPSETVQKALQENILKVFKKDHGPSGKWSFTGTVDTDGQSIHPHFQRAKTEEELKAPPGKAKKTQSFVPEKLLEATPRLLYLVDPGRVNLATITVMVDGKPVMVEYGSKKRKRPLKFTFTNRQYYTLIGSRKRAAILKQKRYVGDAEEERILHKKIADAQMAGRPLGPLETNDTSASLRSKLSQTSLRSGKATDILAYMQAQIDAPSTYRAVWNDALSKRASTDRWRQQMSRDRAMLKWFYAVKKKVRKLVVNPLKLGSDDATVVWGCQVSPTGQGNLSVPTNRIHQLARRVEKWKVVVGDEYNSSKMSCVDPYPENLSPRFGGQQAVRRVKRPSTVKAQVRKGFVKSLDAKKTIKRTIKRAKKGIIKELAPIGNPSKGKRSKDVVRWTYDGHSGESVEEKTRKKTARMEKGLSCRYARGLRVYIKDKETTKFVDRDVNGSLNIGTIWIGDNVNPKGRPSQFVRPKKKKSHEPIKVFAPRSKHRVRGVKPAE